MQICNAGAKYEVRREADFLATPGQGAVPAIDSAASPTLQHWQRRKCEVTLRTNNLPGSIYVAPHRKARCFSAIGLDIAFHLNDHWYGTR